MRKLITILLFIPFASFAQLGAPQGIRYVATAGGGPLDFATFSPDFLWDIRKITWKTNGSSLDTLPDGSSNNNYGYQSGTNRGVFNTNVVNGQPAVTFSASSSQYYNLHTAINSSASYTLIIVYQKTASGDFAVTLGTSDPANTPYTWFSYLDDRPYTFTRTNNYTQGPVINDYGVFHLVVQTGQTTNLDSSWIDATYTALTPQAGSGGTNDFVYFGRSASNYGNMKIAFVFFKKAKLRYVDRIAIQAELKSIFNLP